MRVLIPTTQVRDTKHAQRVRKMLEERKPLWVVNSSDEQFNTKAVHFITFTDATGRTRHINFPDTYLPVCITNEIDADVLLASPDFWAYINRGLIKAIPPKRARRLLDMPEAEEEQERLRVRQRGARGAKRGDRLRRQAGVRPTGATKFDSQHPDDRGKDMRAEDEGPKVQNRVMAVCGRVEAGQLGPRPAIAELRNMKLSREDLGYIMGNARYMDSETRESNDSVADWASDQLYRRAIRSAKKRGGAAVDPVMELLGQDDEKTARKAKKRKKAKTSTAPKKRRKVAMRA